MGHGFRQSSSPIRWIRRRRGSGAGQQPAVMGTVEPRAVLRAQPDRAARCCQTTVPCSKQSFHGGTAPDGKTRPFATGHHRTHHTPQLANRHDARINARINEFKNNGWPTPAYRRVGTYAVFCFCAPDERRRRSGLTGSLRAGRPWLGNNPRLLDALKESIAKRPRSDFCPASMRPASRCHLSRHRRHLRQHHLQASARAAATTEAYSVRGVLRLNLDDMTPKVDPSRLWVKAII